MEPILKATEPWEIEVLDAAEREDYPKFMQLADRYGLGTIQDVVRSKGVRTRPAASMTVRGGSSSTMPAASAPAPSSSPSRGARFNLLTSAWADVEVVLAPNVVLDLQKQHMYSTDHGTREAGSYLSGYISEGQVLVTGLTPATAKAEESRVYLDRSKQIEMVLLNASGYARTCVGSCHVHPGGTTRLSDTDFIGMERGIETTREPYYIEIISTGPTTDPTFHAWVTKKTTAGKCITKPAPIRAETIEE
jgi:proteasome lid subunit RPN8/RPN11